MKKIRIVGTPEMQTGGKVRNNIPVYASQYPTAYDPYTGTIQMNPAQFSNPQVYPHEAYHELQDRMGTMSDRSKWSGPLQRPSIVNADDMKREYFNRQQSDMDSITNRFIAGRPEFQMSPRDIIQQGYSRGQQYREPWTMEGEATNYANSQVPQHKQGGPVMMNTGKRKVRITPPAQETAVPQPFAYGGALPSGQYGYNQFDNYGQGQEYDIHPQEAARLKSMGYEFDVI